MGQSNVLETYPLDNDPEQAAIEYATSRIVDFLEHQKSPSGKQAWEQSSADVLEFLKIHLFEGWAYSPDDGAIHAISENIIQNSTLGNDRKALFLIGFIQGYIAYWTNNTLSGFSQRGNKIENRGDTLKAVASYHRTLGEILDGLRRTSNYPLPAVNDERFHLMA